ncbi:MAG: MATE family efflux transporter [Buchnera aphidicola (Schlechtendalia peitan)]
MKKYLEEIKVLTMITIPIMLAQISQISMGLVNSTMVKSLNNTDIAAMSIGISIWYPIILFGHGLLLSLVPTISYMNGSGKKYEIPNQIINAYWLATIISIIIMIILWNAHYIINIANEINPVIEKKSINYIRILLWSTPGYLYFQVIQNQCEGFFKPKPAMIVGLMGLILNILINYLLIYTKILPSNFKNIGCACSMTIVYWFMFFLMKIITKYDYSINNVYYTKSYKYLPNFKIIWNLSTIGLPIALSIFFEVALFTLITLLIASLNITQIIAHQIVLNISSFIFILPLSIGTATSIRIGFYLGQKNFNKISTIIISAQTIGLILSTTISIFIVLFCNDIITLYTTDSNVIKRAREIMLIAATYQIFDFFQIIGNGILRSYKDTHMIFIITCISYWILGFPIGYLLALTDTIVPKLGATGFWIGIFISLVASSLMTLCRILSLQTIFTKHQKHNI